MLRSSFPLLLSFLLLSTLTSCELIGDIFQAGFSVGIFVAVAVLAVILWLIFRARS